MKANELMIGDWVLGLVEDNEEIGKIIAKHPARIIKIEENGDYAAQCPYTFDEMYEGDGTLIEDFLWYDTEPIPLTKEIVEKNGFKSTPAFGERALLKETFEIWIDFKEKRHWINIKVPAPIKSELHLHYYEGYVEYVHELQHLLRDCELFVLADNFKV